MGSLWRRDSSQSLPSLFAAGRPIPPIRRSCRPPCPLSGCRRTRTEVGVVSNFSTRHPLCSTGITRLPSSYGVIRLLRGHRTCVAAGPTASADPGRSHGVRNERLRAAPASTTVPPRLDTGRCIGGHAHPSRAGLTEIRLRSVLHCALGFHPTCPHGAGCRRPVVSHPTQLPSAHDYLQSGLVGDFHPQTLIHAHRTLGERLLRRRRLVPEAIDSGGCGRWLSIQRAARPGARLRHRLASLA